METQYLLISAPLILIIIWLWSRKRHFEYFKKLGIPGPEPNILFGNLFEYGRKGASNCQVEWGNKYGHVYGFFLGKKPIIAVTDLELLKQIQIKDFNNFNERELLMTGGGVGMDVIENSLISLHSDKWKRLRSILTPNFSTGKLKQISYLMNRCLDVLLDKINAKYQKNESLEMKEAFGRFTLDNIIRSAFGVETNVQSNENDIIYLSALQLPMATYSNPVFMLCLSFPIFEKILLFVMDNLERIKRIFNLPSISFIIDSCVKAHKLRQQNPQSRRHDILQILMDTRFTDEDLETVTLEDVVASSEIYSIRAKDERRPSLPVSPSSKRLSNNEVIGNMFLFMAAGFDTTAAFLGYAVNLLIRHPDVQDKIKAELDKVLSDQEVPDYEAISQLSYMDQVTKEVLRLYPSTITFVTRKANVELRHNNIVIPKGASVQVPMFALHRKAEYFDNPEEFNPERFSLANKSSIPQMAYQPFGEGPRNCVGARFAMIVAKLALARIFRTYKLFPANNLDKKVEVDDYFFVMHPKKPLEVKFKSV